MEGGDRVGVHRYLPRNGGMLDWLESALVS